MISLISNIKRINDIPKIGQRILKTTAAVFICMMIHMMRGYNSILTEAAVAAIICIQPYRKDSKKTSINRILGTIMGALWGLAFLLLMYYVPLLSKNMIVVYIFMALGVLLTLYFSILIHQSENAGLAAIIYICIVAGYPNIGNPLAEMGGKLLDTIVGIMVAALVNAIHLPRKKHPEYLFFIRMQDLSSRQFSQLSSSVLVLINHLLGDGARICLTSRWAPAFLLAQIGFLDMKLPVIVMDGACLYDIRECKYENIIPIPRQAAQRLRRLLEDLGLGYRVYTVRNDNMFIYSFGRMNEAENADVSEMKRSPYRNYMDGDYSENDYICFVRVLDKTSRINEIQKKLSGKPGELGIRMTQRLLPVADGYSGIYFYNEKATIESQQLEVLRRLTEESGTTMVKVSVLPRRAYKTEEDAVSLLAKIRSRYEPVYLPLIGEIGRR